MKSILQNVKVVLSVSWPFEKCTLQYFQFDIAEIWVFSEQTALKQKLLKSDRPNQILTKLKSH